jgi:hypothetical protein
VEAAATVAPKPTLVPEVEATAVAPSESDEQHVSALDKLIDTRK